MTFGRSGRAMARALLVAMAVVVWSVPRGAALATPPRGVALHELTQNLDMTVSWCVTQFDALQHQYIAYRSATSTAPTQDDVTAAQDACLTAGQQIPPVLRRYMAVTHMVQDWTGVLQQFDAAIADIYGVVFLAADRAAADKDVVRRLYVANNLAQKANHLTEEIVKSWQQGGGG